MQAQGKEYLLMPKNYTLVDKNEMTYVEGGRTKTYYNKAGTLANTFGVLKNAFQLQSIAYAASISGINFSGIIPAQICQHNAEMYAYGKSLCEKYSYDTYVTAIVQYDNIFSIGDVTVRKGK